MAHENKCEEAISRQDHDTVVALLPSLQHQDKIQCDVRAFVVEYELLKLPQRSPLLHICALLGWIYIVQLLVTMYSYSPLQEDSCGYIALHYAALGGYLDVVQYFIQECSIDPTNGSGHIKAWQAPLHLAAYSGKQVEKVFLDTEMKLRTIQYLIEKRHCDPMVRDIYERTPLHYAAAGGDFIMTQYLINCGCDPMARDQDGRTPVHYALRYGHFLVAACLNNDHAYNCHSNKYNYKPLHEAILCEDLHLCQHLITDQQHDPMCSDGYGCTPLHVACRIGCIPIIQYLLSFPAVDPLATDICNKTPMAAAEEVRNHDKIASSFKAFSKVRISHTVGSFVNILLLGDPKAGKTTLTQVIKDRASKLLKFGTVKQVESSTAGIVPTQLKNTELGSVILHDFAGQSQYYSSHTAVLENLLSNSGAVFLLLINLTQDVLKQIHFWWSIVVNECTKVSSQCHLIIIGSHVDQVSNSQSRLALLSDFASKQVTSSNINIGGVFTLNCCQRSGNSLKVVLTELSTMCKAIRSKQSKEISLFSNFLYELLDSNASTQNIYTLPEIEALCEQARKQGIPLPDMDVTPLLTDLHSSGLIVYLKRNYTDSWIIVCKEILLKEVDGILFAPTDFAEHHDIASNTGIITTTALAKLFPFYTLDMLISFLQFMKLCEQLEPSLLDATNFQLVQESMISHENILFFPALIAQKRPQEIEEHFKIGWCLKCEPGQFFSVRFLHVLLLQLAYRYALPLPHATSLAAGLRRRCSVWINGIYWSNTDGVKTLVEQLEDNQCVILLMSCQSGAKQDMMQLHCELVQKIVSLQQQYCPILQCTEYLIEPSQLHYPFDQPSELSRYYMKELVSCIEEGKRAVVQQDGLHSTAIDELLPIKAKKYLSLRCDSESQDIYTNPYKSKRYQREGGALDTSDLDIVLESVKDVADWMELGLMLGIEYSTLEKIEEERRGRVERCKREMLAAWLRGEDNAKEQTWSTLVDALKRMDKITLAETIGRK